MHPSDCKSGAGRDGFAKRIRADGSNGIADITPAGVVRTIPGKLRDGALFGVIALN
jgi:hypothetical protein